MQRAPHTARRSPRNMRHPVPVCNRASCLVRTHRLGVGDRAALERDRPVAHRDHAAVLRTTEPHPPPPPSLTAPAAAHAHRPRHPSLPARAHLCFGARYRHAVEQRGALLHGDHAAAVLRTSAARRTLGKGVRPPPPSSSMCDAQRTTRTMPECDYSRPIQCSVHCVQHAVGPRSRAACSAAGTIRRAPRSIPLNRPYSPAMERVHAHQITLVTTHRPTYSRAPHASQTGCLSRAGAALCRATPQTKSELNFLATL